MPGVVLLDEGLRALAAHRSLTEPIAAEHCRLGAAKFLSFVRPGEALRLEVEVSGDATTASVPAFRLKIFAGPVGDERVAVSGNVTFERVAGPSVEPS